MSTDNKSPRGPEKRPSSKKGSALGYFLTLPSRALEERRKNRERQRREMGGMAAPTLGQRLWRIIASPFTLLEMLVGGTIRGIGYYATSRNGIFLLQGLPALLVALGTTGLGAAAVLGDRNELIKWYKDRGDEAFEEAAKLDDTPENKEKKQKLVDEARVCFERTAISSIRDPEPKYKMALADLMSPKESDRNNGINKMETLAPINEPGGFQLAHNWLAKYYIDSMKVTQDPRAKQILRDKAEVHLMRALMLNQSDFSAHVYLAQIYFQHRRFDRAESHLKVATAMLPEANADLASLYKSIGKDDLAREYSAKAIEYLTKELETRGDSIEIRAKLAQQYILIKDYSKAVEILDDGLKLSEDSRYRKVMANVLAELLFDIPDNQWDERMLIYDKIVLIDPSNPEAFRYLVTAMTPGNPLYAVAEEKAKDTLLKTNSPFLHWMLSNVYINQGKYQLAQKHLEACLEVQPQFMEALNNLAHILAREETPNYPRAMDLINACLKQAEQMNQQNAVGAFYDTRGQIYLRMRKPREAIADLQRAVNQGMMQNLSTHESLLRAYQETGQTELATDEAKIVRKLREIQDERKVKVEEGEKK